MAFGLAPAIFRVFVKELLMPMLTNMEIGCYIGCLCNALFNGFVAFLLNLACIPMLSSL